MNKNIALIYGDCSSPEIVTQAVRVLDKIAAKHGHTFSYTRAYMGGEAIDKFGDPLPAAELEKCKQSDSVLLGAIGGPKWEGMPGDRRPEKGLLRLRAGMGLYANNRPAKIYNSWRMPAEKVHRDQADFIIVRNWDRRRRLASIRPSSRTVRRSPSTRCRTLSMRSSASAVSALRRP